MLKRPRPRQHLIGTVAWICAAVAGLWPAIPGVADAGRAMPVTFLDLVALSGGVLGVVAVVGLASLLAAVLHLLSALDLWLDERALLKGGAAGAGRPVRLGLAAAVMLATLVGGSYTAYHHLRVDGHGNYASLIEGWTAKAPGAWRALDEALRTAAPPPVLAARIPLLGEDPVPLLRRLRRYPAVGVAYHVAPDGRLTLLWPDERAGRDEVVRRDLRTWRAPAGRPVWPVMGPPPRGNLAAWRREAVDAFIARLAAAHGRFRYATTWGEGFGFRLLDRHDDQEQVFFAVGALQRGFLGFAFDEGFLDRIDGVGDRILQEAEIPGAWEIGPVRGEPYFLPRVGGLGGFTEPIRLVVDSSLDERGLQAHAQGVIMLLATLVLGFVAATVETVRQFRALIAERAMAMAQSSFVSGVSHEMRTPLATVRLYAELLEQRLDRDAGQREEFVAAILHEVDRLHRLIENVLDFARISGRKRTYAFVPTDLRAVVEEAVQAASGPLTAAGLQVEVHAPTELTAAVDRDAVVHALTNLLTNAAKYAAEGGRVWVSALPGPLGATLAVQDFGPGIAQEDRAKVFHPFHRLAGSAAGGSGLGLALVREYARAHGGGVELDSTLGQGATFKIHLPLDPAEAPAARQAAPCLRAFAAIRRRAAA